MMNIPYATQDIDKNDIQSVIETLKSDWLTQGPAIDRFEKAVAEYCGARYAVAVTNATAALHIACLSLELNDNDLLWTTPNSFVASANCGRYCGADVDFVDIDRRTYNMSVEALEKKLIEAKKIGRLPKVVIPVHFSGQSCEMKGIKQLAHTYGFSIIEDASHAIGGSYLGYKVGSCQFSDATVFSFHPVKIITTGEGGMVVTNRQDLYERLVLLRSHGITRNPELMVGDSHGPWYYQQVDLGFNYRMTDVQAALGFSQLKRINEFIERRHALVNKYNEAFQAMPLTVPWQHLDSYSAFHLYVIRVHLEKISRSKREIFEELRSKGIGVNLHYIPIHTQPYYEKLGFKMGDFPEAEKYYAEAISLPMYFGLSYEQQDYVIETVKEVIR